MKETWESVNCGLCVTASDIGLSEFMPSIAYVNPTCPDHGEVQEDE